MQLVNEVDVDWDNINYGNCTECSEPLQESDFAVGDVCAGCKPAFMETWERQQEAEQGRRNEEVMYPEISDDDNLCIKCDEELGRSQLCVNPHCS